MEFKQIEKLFCELIVDIVGPNNEQDAQREDRIKIIKEIILKSIEVEDNIIPHVISFGSFRLKSYLQESDIDITVILEEKDSGVLHSNYSFDYLNK